MQILEIVLFNEKGQKRVLSLQPGKLNIITGASKTGKSSLIDIIEYCLGSESCNVPAGIIRETVAWYGLLLRIGRTNIFVARSAPKHGKNSNSDVYLDIGKGLTSPDAQALKSTTNPEAARDYLTGLMGTPENMHVPPTGQTRPSIVAGLKHALIFCFQAQDEIANRNFLFHRQGEPFLPQSIKDTLPFFLGAVPEDRLVKLANLRKARAEFNRIERKVQEAARVQGEGLSKGFSLLTEAEELGLLQVEERPKNATELVAILSPILDYELASIAPVAGDGVAKLRDENRGLYSKHEKLREELRFAKHFESEQSAFSNEASEQKVRLQSISLLDGYSSPESVCGMCSRPTGDSIPQVSEFEDAIRGLSTQLEGVGNEKTRLRDYISKLEEELAAITERLVENQSAISSALEQQKGVRDLQKMESARTKVVGRASLYLESIDTTDEIASLKSQMEKARELVDKIESDLDEENIEENIASITNVISRGLSKDAKQFELEHSDSALRLDIKRLTVVADTENGPVPMDKMGSGENWLGYHLLAHLNLHKWFIKKRRPVPNFLILDQPSQVYYPPDQDKNGSITGLANEDKKAVLRIFDVLYKTVKQQRGKLQVIVTDHADISKPWFKESVAERWRGGTALVPMEWSKKKKKKKKSSTRK